MALLYFQEFNPNQHSSSLILLHGLFGQSDNLLNIAKHFATDYRVIVPDLINHGRSFHSKAMAYADMAAAVKALADDLHISQSLVVGHSMGGKVAMQLALNYPNFVSQLVVVDIAPVNYANNLHSNVFKALFAVTEQSPSTRKAADDILSEYVEEQALRQFLLKNFKRNSEGVWQWQFALDEIFESYSDLAQAPITDNAYQGPTLFVKGGDSDYIKSEYQPEVVRLFPKAQLKIMQGAGHWLHAEKPKAFMHLLTRFFNQS
jgi:esterase